MRTASIPTHAGEILRSNRKPVEHSPAGPRSPGQDVVKVSRGFRRVLYLGLAFAFLTLAALGAILPLLPTTPFLLLATYFLARAWPRLNRVIERSTYFGPILRDWQQHRGVRREVKVQTGILMAMMVMLSAYLLSQSSVAVGILLCLAVIGLTVVVRLPEIGREHASH